MLSPVSGIEVGGGDVASVGIGGEHPLALVAGPCVLEAPQRVGRSLFVETGVWVVVTDFS